MEKQCFNNDWIFHKQGSDERTVVILPHDAMILEERAADNPGGPSTGYFPGGVYEYEKTFFAPQDWDGKCVLVEFEGVYQNSVVTLNSEQVGGCPYGYSPFVIDLSDWLHFGSENTLRVVADNSKLPNSRWYTGSGIYRPVWLHIANEHHIRHQGVQVSTLSYNPARIRVDTAHTGGEVDIEILFAGRVVASGRGDSVELDIPNAQLWSEDSPALYQCRAVLSNGESIVDETTEPFGIRLVEWSNKGLFINGKETLLRGACVHHDNGILGARCYAESEERRVRILKETGYNAIRSSHNPASKAMLAACDRYGVYMIDETWDMWYARKSRYDYADRFMDWFEYDIKAMVERDFNHPSVIMYSIANEVAEPYQQKGIELAGKMVSYIHSLDQNRAVTAGINLFLIHNASKGRGIYKEEGGRSTDEQKASGSLFFNMIATFVGPSMNKMANSEGANKVTKPMLDMLDIAGYNYSSGRYPKEGRANPGRVLYGSETFPMDIAKNWGMVKKLPYLVGDFMWTGWDYIGEAGCGGWNYNKEGGFEKPFPWLLADTGAIDILGNAGAEAAYAATVWGLRDKPYIGVRPPSHPGVRVTKSVWRGTNAVASWAWRGCEGNSATIEVYTDAYEVELLQDGKRRGKKAVKNYRATFKTRYKPGTLTAVAYDRAGRETGRNELTSAMEDIYIEIKPEKERVCTGEVVYVPVQLCDKKGIVESNADMTLSASVDGGELLAFGSANPRTEERYNSGHFTTYYGRALAVVRVSGIGNCTVVVKGGGLAAAQAVIAVD